MKTSFLGKGDNRRRGMLSRPFSCFPNIMTIKAEIAASPPLFVNAAGMVPARDDFPSFRCCTTVSTYSIMKGGCRRKGHIGTIEDSCVGIALVTIGTIFCPEFQHPLLFRETVQFVFYGGDASLLDASQYLDNLVCHILVVIFRLFSMPAYRV